MLNWPNYGAQMSTSESEPRSRLFRGGWRGQANVEELEPGGCVVVTKGGNLPPPTLQPLLPPLANTPDAATVSLQNRENESTTLDWNPSRRIRISDA
ncbi:unnamed protein product [Rhizoctonia solani]|uniref:Uncharacterized protein n=1 Tax=Rhizoctonia solani TaxID=456999 RepID=A0A8H3CU04_9AGAM|nr:unnamed protein product [Rhizoctonia solani]